MDAREKLLNLQEQKKKLKQRLGQIGDLQSKSYVQDPELQRLLLKKKELEEQRKKKAQYEKLQKQYNERKKQMQREKELQRIQNQKRVLELQAAMKRVVFQGIKQKVKGMNSEQLMKRGFLNDQDQPQFKDNNKENGNFKEVFEGYLLDQGPEKIKQKYNVKELNQKRMELFERKQQVVMRQILLKELAASQQHDQLDVMSLNRNELIKQLQKRQIDFEQFMHPIRKEDIIQHLPLIKEAVQHRLDDKKRQIEQEKEEALNLQRNKKQLRDQIKALPYKSVQVVKRLLYDFFDQICDDYQKRHVPLSEQDQNMRARNLEQQYIEVSNQGLVEQLSQQIIKEMLEDMHMQMMKESAQQIVKLHDYAHQKTEDCFKSIFNEGDVYQKIQELDKYKFPLVFVSEEENQVGRIKEDKYMKKLQNDYGIYETQQNTTNLVNDIALLDAQQKYMDKVISQANKKIQYKTEDTLFYYDRELLAINRQNIKAVQTGKIYYSINSLQDPLTNAVKMNRNWLLQSERQILLLTPWGREVFGNPLGARISNPCGLFTFSSLYPVNTLLGNPCSAMLGFQKGQILKFNFNRNRVTGKQLNLTHYLPVIDNAKSGDDPAFPLDNKNYLPVQISKPKPTDQLHEYRQFFEHHSEPVIFVGFYRIDKIITVDKSLKCGLWQYSKSKGTATYQPAFKFQIRSSYQVFTQDQNPRYKDIYPISDSNETPELMYQKYMLTENFLKLQLYNNPKKEIAYFKAPSWDKSNDQKPIWKITYKDSKSQVNKILQSFYNVSDGKITAQQALISNDSLYVLCEREHIIRNDLKTIKIFSWNINQKRLGRVGLEIDMFKDQKVSNFIISNNLFKGVEAEFALIVNSGRLLLFSLVSGQLLKNINQEVRVQGKQTDLYFKSIVKCSDKAMVYGISNGGIMQLSWQDSNSINEHTRLNKAIDGAKRKFFR